MLGSEIFNMQIVQRCSYCPYSNAIKQIGSSSNYFSFFWLPAGSILHLHFFSMKTLVILVAMLVSASTGHNHGCAPTGCNPALCQFGFRLTEEGCTTCTCNEREFFCMFICLFFCPSVCLSIYLPFCLSVCPSGSVLYVIVLPSHRTTMSLYRKS